MGYMQCLSLKLTHSIKINTKEGFGTRVYKLINLIILCIVSLKYKHEITIGIFTIDSGLNSF